MFYNNATLVTNSRGPYRGKSNSGKEALCANPEVPVATATCCTSSTRAWWAGGGGANTVFTGERVSHELAKERCAPIWGVTKTDGVECLWEETDWDFSNAFWTNRPCTVQVQVNQDGMVSMVNNDIGPNGKQEVMLDNLNYFLVRWEGGEFPRVKDDCAGSDCLVHTSETGQFSCLCNITVENDVVFGSGDRPSRDEVLANLKIGEYDTTGAARSWGDVTAYEKEKETGNGTVFTSFKVVDDVGRTIQVKNEASLVRLGGSEGETMRITCLGIRQF